MVNKINKLHCQSIANYNSKTNKKFSKRNVNLNKRKKNSKKNTHRKEI